jgi:hypothetical protein
MGESIAILIISNLRLNHHYPNSNNFQTPLLILFNAGKYLRPVWYNYLNGKRRDCHASCSYNGRRPGRTVLAAEQNGQAEAVLEPDW